MSILVNQRYTLCWRGCERPKMDANAATGGKRPAHSPAPGDLTVVGQLTVTTRRGNLHTQATGTAAKITPSLSNRESAWLPHKGKAPFVQLTYIKFLAGIAAAAEPELGPNGQFGQLYQRSGASTSCRVRISGALTAWYAGARESARRHGARQWAYLWSLASIV